MKTENEIIDLFNSLTTDPAHKVIPGANDHALSLKNNNAPLFIKKAKGSFIYDADNNEYIDFHLSGGAHILGHHHEMLINTVKEALEKGAGFGMPSPDKTALTNAIIDLVPSIEMVQLADSGTEATMSAIRLARAYTGSKKIIKFDGCYHGHVDHLLMSDGVPEEFLQHTINLPFNDELPVFEAFSKYKDDIAAVIVEPVPANMGVILPKNGFLEFLRNITSEYNSLLIFDEVITGFRPKVGGAQGYFGVRPDLTILGKVISDGLPFGAFGGQKDIMSRIIHQGDIYQAKTLSGNPIALAVGIATLKKLRLPQFYEPLNRKSLDFTFLLEEITKNKGIVVNSFESMFTLFFQEQEVTNYEQAKKSDLKRFEKFYKLVLDRGIFFSPSQFGANFISVAHLPSDLNKTLEVIHETLKRV